VATTGPEFDSYFDRRAERFASFYGTEWVSRALGRGPLFDRLRWTVEIVVAIGAKRVLDVGCGSGPLFAPLASRGIHVLGIDPAPSKVALARAEARRFPGFVDVQEGKWEELAQRDAFGAAVALGVFDYLDEPMALLRRMADAAPHVVASFPAPGVRLELRKFRYGRRGVHVNGYSRDDLEDLAERSGLDVDLRPLGRAGNLAHFTRSIG